MAQGCSSSIYFSLYHSNFQTGQALLNFTNSFLLSLYIRFEQYPLFTERASLQRTRLFLEIHWIIIIELLFFDVEASRKVVLHKTLSSNDR